MGLVINKGLKYGTFKGFDYVYGVPFSNSMDEVLSAFPVRLKDGQRIDVLTDGYIGNVYIVPKVDGKKITNDVMKHIRDEYYASCYEWFQFDNASAFLSYLSVWRKSKRCQLFIDKLNNKYYARHTGLGLDTVAEYACCLDLETSLVLQENVMLTEVK